MDLKTQYICFGLLYTKKYTYDRQTGEVRSNRLKRPLNAILMSGKKIYRLYLGESQRMDIPADELIYIYHYGIIPPNAKIIHRDNNPDNISIDNLAIQDSEDRIPQEIKEKAYNLYDKSGCTYAEIGRQTGVTRHQARDIIRDRFGEYALPRNVKIKER